MSRDFDPLLYLVTDRGLMAGRGLEEVVHAAVRGGATMVQLREKRADDREVAELARALVSLLSGAGVPLIINDRVEVARAVGAAGVHLGQSDMLAADARALLGPDAIIGLSVETPEQAHEAEGLDVDYLGVSPIFETPTKAELTNAWGLDGLARLRRSTSRVLVAIGGIGPDNAADVLAAGADGVAVVSAICASPDPLAAARSVVQSLQSR